MGGTMNTPEETPHPTPDSSTESLQSPKGVDLDTVRDTSRFISAISDEVARQLVGQTELLERLLLALLCRGHVLLEGVPGLAKTLLLKSVAQAIHTDFQRVQFTPDLLPADVVGTQIYVPDRGEFTVKHGPIFTNILLADEINRAPAKVQSALLEGMGEGQVTIGEETFQLPSPFLVLATQNPIEQEGTYPLPEAQMDRFMFKLKVDYPIHEEEIEIMRRMAGPPPEPIQPVATVEHLMAASAVVDELYVDEKLLRYVADLVVATRTPSAYGIDDLDGLIAFGASPRASIALVRAAKAHAYLRQRNYVIPEDIRAVGTDVLRHRVLLTFEADAEEIPVESVIDRIFDRVETP